jgi:ABC-2 type transport system ATP-binding protein
MKQRLLLCMALVSEPDVLLLDEPTAGLDVQSTRLIRSILNELKDEGRTILLTTHNMEEAGSLCQRVAIINHGRIIATDSPQRLRLAAARLKAVDVVFTGRVGRKALLGIPGVMDASASGEGFHLVTDSPGELVERLVDFARGNGVKISMVNVSLPSLEDVFVELTGGGAEL